MSDESESDERHEQSDLEERLRNLSPLVNLLDQAREAIVSPLANTDSTFSHLDLRPPDRLGDFELLSPIGRGGMGVVYEARQRSLDRIVAIKVLPKSVLPESEVDSGPEPTSQQNLVKRFHVEARAAARLHHTNIVPVYGFGEDSGFYFFVMQRIYGKSLDHWIEIQYATDSEDSLRTQELAKVAGRFGFQAASALAYAHGEGILHRDVKPANLLVDEDDNLLIADFGIARIDDSEALTKTSDVVGTLRYMAPEQVLGESSPISDVYSLGVTLYELVTGTPAIDDASVRNAVLLQKRPKPPVPLSRCNPGLPTDLTTIIEKAMMPELDDRYESASAMADDLQRFIDGRPIIARRPPWWERSARWVRKNQAIATLTSLVVLALSIAAAISVRDTIEISQLLDQQESAKRSAQNTADLATSAMEKVFSRFSSSSEATSIPFETTDFSAPHVDPKTAALLEDLLGYYDSLASQRLIGSESEQRIRPEVARMHVGAIHAQLGNHRSAVEAFRQALQEVESDSLLAARLENQIGIALQAMGNQREAKSHYKIALELLQRHPRRETDLTVRFEIARTNLLAVRRLRPGMGPQEGPPPAGFLDFQRFADVRRASSITSFSVVPPIDGAEEDLRSNIRYLIELEKDCPDSIPVKLLLASTVREALRDSLRARLSPRQDMIVALANEIELELEEIIQEKTPTGNDATARFELVRLLTDFNVFRPLKPREVGLALELLERAVPHVDHLVRKFPNVPAYETLAIHTWYKTAAMRFSHPGPNHNTDFRSVRTILRQAFQHQFDLTQRTPNARGYQLWCCLFLMRIGDVQNRSADFGSAYRSYRRALRMLPLLSAEQQKEDPDRIEDGWESIRIASIEILNRYAQMISGENADDARLIVSGLLLDDSPRHTELRKVIDELIQASESTSQ